MVSSFLSSVAQLLRKLVFEDRAVHCTEADAVELEMLAGLFEQYQPPICRCEPDAELDEPGEAPTHYKRTCEHCGHTWDGLHCPHEDFQNSCSRCNKRPTTVRGITPADIAFGWLRLARVRTVEVEIDDGRTTRDAAAEADVERAAVCAELVAIAMSRRGCTGCVPGWDVSLADVSPHDGTIEGARAAWEFIVAVFEKNSHGMFHPLANIDGQPIALGVMERFRRELEAMR